VTAWLLRKEVENMNSGAQVLQNIVKSNLKRASLQDERTCLVFRSVLELTNEFMEEKQEVKEVYDQILNLYKAVIEKAQKEGVINKSKDPDILARYLYSSLNGLRLMANIENNPKVLKPMSEQILSNITG
jgi:hypothetical protein